MPSRGLLPGRFVALPLPVGVTGMGMPYLVMPEMSGMPHLMVSQVANVSVAGMPDLVVPNMADMTMAGVADLMPAGMAQAGRGEAEQKRRGREDRAEDKADEKEGLHRPRSPFAAHSNESWLARPAGETVCKRPGKARAALAKNCLSEWPAKPDRLDRFE